MYVYIKRVRVRVRVRVRTMSWGLEHACVKPHQI